MWRLIRLEWEYVRLRILVALAIVVPAVAYAHHTSLLPGGWDRLDLFVCWGAAFCGVEAWTGGSRARQLALLPLSARRVALARLLSWSVPLVVSVGLYACVRMLPGGARFTASSAQVILGAILLLHGGFFVAQDALGWRPVREVSLRRLWRPLLVVVALQAAVAWLAIALALGRAPASVACAADGVRRALAAPFGAGAFVAVTAIIASLSLVTYPRRRSYLEE